MSLTNIIPGPEALRLPGFYGEFDGSQALQGAVSQSYRVLIIGQKLAAGTATAGKAIQITTASDLRDLFGQGSHLVGMCERYLQANSFTETWVLPIDDPGAATSAGRLLTVASAPTAAGTVYLLIGGQSLQVALDGTETVEQARDKILNAINADADLVMEGAATSTNQITVTAKNAGEFMRGVTIKANFYAGQEFPAGFVISEGQLTGGSGVPDIDADFWDNLDETQYHLVVSPYVDTASLAAMDLELADRWGPERAIEGHAIHGSAETFANLSTLGDGLNSRHLTIVAATGSPTPHYEVAASTAALVASSGAKDPARPFQTLELVGCIAPRGADQLIGTERNNLLFDGISTVRYTPDGKLLVERLITTRQLTNSGVETIAYLDLNTLLTLSYLRFATRAHFLTKFPRHKLGKDGGRYEFGQPIMTPSLFKAELVALFATFEERALVENVEGFAESLVVAISSSDPTRLEALLKPDLVNQLRILGVNFQFLL